MSMTFRHILQSNMRKNHHWMFRNSVHHTMKRNVSLVAKAACKAHPEKAGKHPQGEDAYFIGPSCAGVADGISAWSQFNIDAGIYARELMSLCEEEFSHMDGDMDAKLALQLAYKRSISNSSANLGTCTACILAVNNNSILNAANLGDSGFIVIRQGRFREPASFDDMDNTKSDQWEVVYRSADMQKFFNCPDQLGANSPDRPTRAETYEVPVEVGDIVIIATDGLFDNFSDNEICITMKRLSSQVMHGVDFQQLHTSTKGLSENLEHIAKSLVEQAHAIGLSESARTPFGKHAIRAGYFYEGGKLDDCCVVVGAVVKNHKEKN